MWYLLLWWFLLPGFTFLIGVGVWVIVTVQRMQREQAIALAILASLEARLDLRAVVERMQSDSLRTED